MTTDVLILCTHNSARSVLVVAMLNHHARRLGLAVRAHSAGSAPMRIVITVCDSAANEVCPIWLGSPLKVHWGDPAPSNAAGDDASRRQAFDLVRQARRRAVARAPACA